MLSEPYVFMGGTFDPIHHGHLRTALEIQQWMGVAQVKLVPTGKPVHKDEPGRSAAQRLAMVELAVAGESALVADDREVCALQASYTLYTLQSLRAELGEKVPICMIIGMDSYQGLPGWREWERFTDFAHLIVVKRPGYDLPETDLLTAFTRKHETTSLEHLLSTAAGNVLFHELTPLGISATQIRETIARGESPRYLLPDTVWNYIQTNRLYGLDN